jgi:DUF1707 SHOCT-like domain
MNMFATDTDRERTAGILKSAVTAGRLTQGDYEAIFTLWAAACRNGC